MDQFSQAVFMTLAELALDKLQLEGAQVPGGRLWDTCRVAQVSRSQSGDQHQPSLLDKNIKR